MNAYDVDKYVFCMSFKINVYRSWWVPSTKQLPYNGVILTFAILGVNRKTVVIISFICSTLAKS
ncbi:hypothetical protein QTP88_005359 [Uroleucon formosanum]